MLGIAHLIDIIDVITHALLQILFDQGFQKSKLSQGFNVKILKNF